MNVHRISLSVIGVVLLTLIVVREPSALGAPDANDSKPAILSRIEALEKAFDSEHASRLRESNAAKARVTELERTMRQNRLSNTGAPTRTQSTDISRLRSENAELKRIVMNLDSKMKIVERSESQLQLRVSSLQRDVERLKSRR